MPRSSYPVRATIIDGKVEDCRLQLTYPLPADLREDWPHLDPSEDLAEVIPVHAEYPVFKVPERDVFFTRQEAEAELSQRQVYAVHHGRISKTCAMGKRLVNDADLKPGEDITIGESLVYMVIPASIGRPAEKLLIPQKNVFKTYEDAKVLLDAITRDDTRRLKLAQSAPYLNLKYDGFEAAALQILATKGQQSYVQLLKAVRRRTHEAQKMRNTFLQQKGNHTITTRVVIIERLKLAGAVMLPALVDVPNLLTLKKSGVFQKSQDGKGIELSARGIMRAQALGVEVNKLDC